MVNIHETIEAFEGKTFSDIILELTSSKDRDIRIFNHFKRAWNMDPSKETWDISVKNQYADEAIQYIQNARESLVDKYGSEIDYFFNKEGGSKEWVDAVNSNKQTQEDDEDWFEEEDDIDELVKKGLIDPAFVQFLKGDEVDTDRQSVASWGTGDTTYTEIVDNHDSSGTVGSSITQESSFEALQDIQKKKETVIDKLKAHGITEDEIAKIVNNSPPYELVFSGIQLKTWKPDKELFYIMALVESNKIPDKIDEDDDDL
jgi:predicted CopG family antitoxin